MKKVNVLVDMFFSELPFPERVAKVAKHGFGSVETWQCGDAALLRKIGEACRENGVEFVSVVLNGVGDGAVAPSWKGNLSAFVERIDKYSDNALAAGCKSGIVTAGNLREDQTTSEHRGYLAEALKEAGALAARKGFNLNLEPLNTIVDHKGYYLDSRDEALEILREVAMPNVRMLYDIYHMTIMHGNQTAFISGNISMIGHFHMAGVPGRNEIFKGETDYNFVLGKAIDAGYKGFFGLEYKPSMECGESLQKTLEYLEP